MLVLLRKLLHQVEAFNMQHMRFVTGEHIDLVTRLEVERADCTNRTDVVFRNNLSNRAPAAFDLFLSLREHCHTGLLNSKF